MDPPVYGRGTNNEVWKIEARLVDLINLTIHILSDEPLFYLVNSYTSAFSPIVLHNIMSTTLNKTYPGNLQSGELGLKTTKTKLILPGGIFPRWEQ